MAYKLDITNIVRDHFKTIVNDGTGRADFRDWFFFLLLPILISGSLLYFRIFLNKDFIGPIISGLSIFVGLSLNLVVLLFEIVQKKDITEFKKGFAKDLIANICFAILLSILTIISSLFTLIECKTGCTPCFLNYITSGLTYFFLTEVILVIILLVRNMYFQMIEQINSTNNND